MPLTGIGTHEASRYAVAMAVRFEVSALRRNEVDREVPSGAPPGQVRPNHGHRRPPRVRHVPSGGVA